MEVKDKMAIRYDGAEFDTVEELIEYKRKCGNKGYGNREEVAPVEREQPEWEEEPEDMLSEEAHDEAIAKGDFDTVVVESTDAIHSDTTDRDGQIWTEDEVNTVINVYEKHAINGRLPPQGAYLKKLAVSLGRTIEAVKAMVFQLKQADRIAKPTKKRKYNLKVTKGDKTPKKMTVTVNKGIKEFVAQFYNSHMFGERLKRGKMDELTNALGVSRARIHQIVTELKSKGKIISKATPQFNYDVAKPTSKKKRKRKNAHKRWTPKEEKKLKTMFNKSLKKDGSLRFGFYGRAGKQLKRTSQAVRVKVIQMGLR